MLDEHAGILLVEDDRVDVMTVQRALKKIEISNRLYVARTGVEALEMLRGQGVPAIAADLPVGTDLRIPTRPTTRDGLATMAGIVEQQVPTLTVRSVGIG